MSQLDIPTTAPTSSRENLAGEVIYEKCIALANNLWWTWHPEVDNLFRDLDPIRWRLLDHNPIALLREFTPKRLETRASEMVLYSRINHAYRQLKEYMSTNRIAFIEDYDINVYRHLIQGVDVWLNNPRRPLEASGTSGQKVVLNGGLNCSILDGWWAEAFDGTNGFAIGTGANHASDEVNDRRDGEALFRVLEEQVIPLYYDVDIDGLPQRWIKMMVNSISSLAWRFSSHRMVMDYARSM